MKELITSSKKDYEELALKLSTDEKQLKAIKEKLIENLSNNLPRKIEATAELMNQRDKAPES